MAAVQPSPTKGERTASRILDVAESLFAENGYSGTSMQDIASAAGIQKASVYNHFSGKDELYNAVLSRGFEPMLAIMSEFVASGDQAYENPHLIGDFFATMARRPDFCRLLQFESLQGGQRLKSMMSAWVDQGLNHGIKALKGSRHGKQWNDEELRLLMFYSFALVMGYFTLAPVYELYTGDDHQSEASMQQQHRFLGKLWHHLWYLEATD